MKFVYLLNTSSYIPYFIYVEILIFNIIMFFVYHTFKNIYMIDYDIKREFYINCDKNSSTYRIVD